MMTVSATILCSSHDELLFDVVRIENTAEDIWQQDFQYREGGFQTPQIRSHPIWQYRPVNNREITGRSQSWRLSDDEWLNYWSTSSRGETWRKKREWTCWTWSTAAHEKYILKQ